MLDAFSCGARRTRCPAGFFDVCPPIRRAERIGIMPPTPPNPYQVWMGQVSTWLTTLPAGPAPTGPWVNLVTKTLQALITLLTPYVP